MKYIGRKLERTRTSPEKCAHNPDTRTPYTCCLETSPKKSAESSMFGSGILSTEKGNCADYSRLTPSIFYTRSAYLSIESPVFA